MKTQSLIFFAFAIVLANAALGIDSDSHTQAGFPNGPAASKSRLETIFKIDPDFKEQSGSWIMGAATNGLLCAVDLSWRTKTSADGLMPEARIYAVNLRSNLVSILYLPYEASFKIAMFDSHGMEVPRTSECESFTEWSLQQCRDYFELHQKQKDMRNITLGIPTAPVYSADVGTLSLPRRFQLAAPGQYDLHLSMMVAIPKSDTNGGYNFTKMFLPEVTAKVQVTSEDIKAARVYWDSKTNAPAK